LVFLYGPPAVGKLTVAKLLAERLGFRVLHNHLTIDAVAPVLDFDTDAFWRVVGRLRSDLVAAAAGEGIDLVYTYVYAPGDEAVIDPLVVPYERAGGVTFVQLLAPREELLRRVAAESRRAHGKITDAATLSEVLDRYDLYSPIPGRETLTLDAGVLSAAEAADRIVAELS
jgi:shikimate kinase